MNRIKKLQFIEIKIAFAATLLLLSLISITEIKAKSQFKAKVLKPNKIYKYDLDGDGKKEKIEVKKKFNKTDPSTGQIRLLINGKLAHKQSLNPDVDGQYTILDLKSSDKFLDLFLITTGSSYTLDFAGFQRYVNKKIKTISSSKKNNDLKFSRSFTLGKIDGKGNFSALDVDTPFYIPAIGNYYTDISFIITGEKVMQKQVSTYSVKKSDFKFKLEKNIKVYEKANKKSTKVKTLKKGDTLTILKIKPMDCVSDNDFKQYSAYVYIKDSKGKKGWIYIGKDFDYKIFNEVPAWG